jgi:hypothetical protein
VIRIITGYSGPGGSTSAFINLTNKLNEAGYKTTLYGACDYPKDKCSFELFRQHEIRKDKCIFHFPPKLNPTYTQFKKPECRISILSCHETTLVDFSKFSHRSFDKVHFVSPLQQKYHKLDHPNQIVIPNFMSKLYPNKKTCGKVAGVIGSIDKNKQTHISIKRAVEDGFKKILLYGMVTEPDYWEKQVKPMVDGDVVVLMGVEENKQKMYDSISDCYLSSIAECLPTIVGECELTGTIFHGLNDKEYMKQKFVFDEKEILNMWKEALELR